MVHFLLKEMFFVCLGAGGGGLEGVVVEETLFLAFGHVLTDLF